MSAAPVAAIVVGVPGTIESAAFAPPLKEYVGDASVSAVLAKSVIAPYIFTVAGAGV